MFNSVTIAEYIVVSTFRNPKFVTVYSVSFTNVFLKRFLLLRSW